MVKIQEVKITISPEGKVSIHFEGIKAEVRHALAKELEKLIGPSIERKHGPGDDKTDARIQISGKKEG